MKYITRQEEFVLLTVHQLKDNAYLVEIQNQLNKLTKKNWSVSSVYVPLDKLERSGFLKTQIGEPTAKRGGRAIKFYSLTEEGYKALTEVKEAHDAVWSKNVDLVYEK
jgi:DNA-binding PadR family transcriptional regulator